MVDQQVQNMIIDWFNRVKNKRQLVSLRIKQNIFSSTMQCTSVRTLLFYGASKNRDNCCAIFYSRNNSNHHSNKIVVKGNINNFVICTSEIEAASKPPAKLFLLLKFAAALAMSQLLMHIQNVESVFRLTITKYSPWFKTTIHFLFTAKAIPLFTQTQKECQLEGSALLGCNKHQEKGTNADLCFLGMCKQGFLPDLLQIPKM